MKKIVLDIYNIIKSNFKSIFIFEIIYRIVSLTVLVRIFEIAVGYILKGSGNSYLNPKNIGTIFTNPLTYPVLIGMIDFKGKRITVGKGIHLFHKYGDI